MKTRLQKLDFVPPQLAAAMSHPTRVNAMSILGARTASPREIAEELDENLNNVTYHLKQLQELGCIELVRSEQVRGGRVLEKFYRAVSKVYFDEAAWSVLSPKEQLRVTTMAIRMISEDLEEAMAAGTFFEPGGAHICRSPMMLDDEGWQEATDLISQATEDLMEIDKRVKERCAGDDAPSIPAKVELLQFRSPSPGERAT